MKVLLRLHILSVVVLLVCSAEAQKALFQFDRITGTKGVTLGKITGITQDKFGYMWFADQSKGSVIRYDGYRMKVYRNISGDSNTITTAGLEAITADSNGNIWIGNINGVDRLNPLQNRVTHYYFPGGRKSHYIFSVLKDHLGIVWVGTENGLFSLDEQTGKFSHYENNPTDSTSLSCNVVYTIYEDRRGVLWIATGWPYGDYIIHLPGGGLNKFDRQTKTFIQYKHDPRNPKSLISDKVRAVFEDSRGNFWVGTKGDGLHLMNRETGTFERLLYDPSHADKLARPPLNINKPDHIPFIIEDGAGAIWIGTYAQGVARYDPATKEIDHFRSETRENGYADSTSWCAFKSHDGALWISTEGKNLYRVDPLVNKISYTGFNAAGAAFMEDPPGTIWVGRFFDGVSKVVTNHAGVTEIKDYQVNGQPEIGVNWICHADSGKYWMASFRGIYKFDPGTAVFTKTSLADTKRHPNTPVISLYNDTKNNILYITGISFRVFDNKSKILTEYWHDPADSTSISGDTLIVAVPDRDGNFWIGTKDAGLDYFDKHTRKFKHFFGDLTVFSVFVDQQETVWAGTMHGLFRKNKNASTFIQFMNPTDEIADASFTGLTDDNEGNIWAASSSGILRINPNTNESALYGRRFGVTDIFWNTKVSAMQATDGKMYVGGADGFYSFYPKEVMNAIKPKIVLTGFKIDGHPVTVDSNAVLKKPIEETESITLKYNQNIFSIDFAAIHYSDPEDNVHHYMLEGYENTWRDAGVEKTAYYFNIPPGNYTFRITAVSSYGATATKSIEIIILPPWWRTWWAYSLYGLLFIIAVWIFIRWRTGMLKRENMLLEEKVAARTKELIATQSQLVAEREAKLIADFNQKFSESELKALRAQMNPHFVFNILNAIESYALDNNKEAASLMIQKFSRLTRMVLENSMSQFVPLKSDLKALQLYIELEQMRYADKFLVNYHIQDEILDEDFLIPPMIIQPFVENAIIHGLRNRPNNNGVLNVSAYLEDEYIVVSIEDNGVGRMKAAQLKINNPIPKRSVGIKVTQDRISIFNNLNERHKAKVDIQDLTEGTRVIIHLPIPV